MTVSGVVVAFRKQALLDCGLWDRDLITEDIGVTWKLERNFWDIRYEPNALCWMLVPETIKGLAKQRKRWAQGGQEVILRHFSVFASWRRRRLIPIYMEQIVSLAWVLAWLLLTLTEIIKLCYNAESYIPYLWKSQYLSIVCLVQFLVAMLLERRYDKDIFKNAITVAWYPVIYWVISGIVALWAIPSSFKKRSKLATWSSPDRGIDTADNSDVLSETDADIQESRIDRWGVNHNVDQDKVIREMPDAPQNDADEHIIKGKQKLWKKLIEYLVTAFCWFYILFYVAYMTYGLVTLAKGKMPVAVWIYNFDVMWETGRILYITTIIFLIEVAIMLIWKEYNRFRFGRHTRRTFRSDVTRNEISRLFTLTQNEVDFYQKEKIITLEKNIIPEDCKAVRPWKKKDFNA